MLYSYLIIFNLNFLHLQGHIETIFDCKFHPENPNWLATGSFDGTIKVWDVNTLNAVSNLPQFAGTYFKPLRMPVKMSYHIEMA